MLSLWVFFVHLKLYYTNLIVLETDLSVDNFPTPFHQSRFSEQNRLRKEEAGVASGQTRLEKTDASIGLIKGTNIFIINHPHND